MIDVGHPYCPGCHRIWPDPTAVTRTEWREGRWVMCGRCGALSICTLLGFTREANEVELRLLNADRRVRDVRRQAGFPLPVGR